MELDEKKTPVVFKALCDENRVRILQYLTDGEKCACKLLSELDIAQPTLSHHMRILTESGIVIGRREGKWMHYSISPEGVTLAMEYLRGMLPTPPPQAVPLPFAGEENNG